MTNMDSCERISDRLQAEQLTAVMRHFPVVMSASFCNAAVLVLSTVGTSAFPNALIWAVSIWSILSVMVWRQWRRRVAGKRLALGKRRGIRHLVLYALTLGLGWAAVPLFFFADASLGGKLLIVCLTSGMLGGGVFALASVPAAAIAHSGPIAIGALVVLLRVGDAQHTLMAVVLTAYSAVLFVGAFNYERELKDLVATQIASERRASVSANNLGTMADMAAALAHELSQPLSAATVYVHAAHRLSQISPHERSFPVETPLLKAITELDNVTQIITHLRNAIEGRETQKEPLHLHGAIRAAIEANRSRQERDEILVETRFAAENDVVEANAVQMRQLLTNLISNAFDAMEDCAERRLIIATRAFDANAIRVDVADSGVGISPAVRARLFEPLITTKAHGLGVGLSIIHSIVDAHDGRIWAEPNPGGGALFVVVLPLSEKARPTGVSSDAA